MSLFAINEQYIYNFLIIVAKHSSNAKNMTMKTYEMKAPLPQRKNVTQKETKKHSSHMVNYTLKLSTPKVASIISSIRGFFLRPIKEFVALK